MNNKLSITSIKTGSLAWPHENKLIEIPAEISKVSLLKKNIISEHIFEIEKGFAQNLSVVRIYL